MEDYTEIMITLINSMAVIAVIAYLMTKIQFYHDIIDKKISWRNRILLIFVFGLLSIYGTISGIHLMGAIANTRDLGPALGGLFAGPIVGVGAGLIGGIHRYSMGGITCVSCSIATVLSGLIGGLVYMWNKGRFVGITGAVVVAIVNQIMHSALTLLIARPFDQAFIIVRDFTIPMIVANGVGMGFYAFIITDMIKERALEKTKQLMDGELQAAHQIQMSMVPKVFPEHASFQLHAHMDPAKEVGGDLYDFFFMDEHRLVFVVGDVSGKGVPASLFMAVTTKLLKAKTHEGIGPHEILAGVNQELCRENDTSMFVTLYCGVLDTRTGQVAYCNAGHNAPVLARPGKASEFLPAGEHPPLGVMEDYPYEQGTFFLSPGDIIFVYTDGVTEAMDRQCNLFSDERLLKSMDDAQGMTVDKLVETILGDVHLFIKGAPPSDDITMLALQYRPNTDTR